MMFLSAAVCCAAGMAQGAPQGVLSLEDCRSLAIAYNKELGRAERMKEAAGYERRAARTKYLPRVTFAGAYGYSSREVSLLSDGQKEALWGLGTTVGSMAPALGGMSDMLNGVGGGLVDALHTDTRSMGAAGVVLTQPLYMGGKIDAYNRITGLAEELAGAQRELTLQDVIVEVDQAYWRIVELQSRKRLAQGYFDLVSRLDGDVQKLVREGFATKVDGLSVKVKVNEARVSLIQVDNGLDISRMLLQELCGLEMGSELTLADEGPGLSPVTIEASASGSPATEEAAAGGTSDPVPVSEDVSTALSRRPELDMLALASRISEEKVKLTRAEYMPTVALTGGYVATYPSVFNGFERRLKGLWNVGVMVKIPLVTCGERSYKMKAARAEAEAARLQLAQTREKVELQVNQSRQRVEEAAERLLAAHSSCEEADENLRYARRGLQEGVVPVSEVLTAQTAWLKAHAEQVSAQVDLRLANVYLRKATGTVAAGTGR